MLSLFTNYKKKDDESLMLLIQQKDEAAFNELFRRYSPQLQNFFFRRTNCDEELTADLTQDLFLTLWSKSQNFKSNFHLRPWLFAIAYNLLKNTYRTLEYKVTYENEIQCAYEEATDDGTMLKIDNEILLSALQIELVKLPESDQILFDLRFSEELSVPEIATIIDIPEGTIKSRLHSLTKKLRLKLQEYGKF